MSAVVGVLLVPASGDPLGLLEEGPCGARPPMAWALDDDEWTESDGHDGSPGRALVLAWGGKPVPEGVDRAGRAFQRYVGQDWMMIGAWPSLTIDDARALAGNIANPDYMNGGRLVLIDASGIEVQP